MLVPVDAGHVIDVLEYLLPDYEKQQERELERFRREVASGQEVVDFPAPDMTEKIETMLAMIEESGADYVLIDEHEYETFFKGEL